MEPARKLTAPWTALLVCALAAPLGAEQPEAAQPSAFGDPPGAKRLLPDADVWVDSQRKLVIIDGEVCLREGQLEMFACPKGTKEHESIISAHTKAFVAHAALLSIGAENGQPVQFAPDYQPATGTEIEIYLLWFDEQGNKQTARAQDWVRNAQTGEAMSYPWVFAGSAFEETPEGKNYYLADAGDFICVSNFSSAMLDLPVQSTQANQGLLFEAFTERIPPVGTKVRMVLSPKLKAAKPVE